MMTPTFKILTPIFVLLLILSSCNSSPDYISKAYEESRPLTEEELREQLMIQECNNSLEYLDGVLSYSPVYKNLLSLKVNGLKITCNIKNNATLATLKDLKVKLSFESKTGTVVFEKKLDIYEFIEPNSSIKYSTEIDITNQQFKDISNLNWSFIGANCK